MADEGALYRIELDIKDLKRQAEEVTNTIHGIGKKAEEEGSRIDGVFKKIGGAMAGYFTAQQALSFAQSIVNVRSEIEGLEVSFKTLLGSEQKASQLFGEIRQFAVNTPMMLNDLSKGAQTLLAFNYDADKVMPTLRALGDISMGDSQKFNSLTLAFAQMSSAGKLMGQDLMQMINAGFNPLAEISVKTGKSIGQLKDEMSEGKISAKMVEEAFISATSEGGKFYGMLEAQSHTMAGALSNLQGAWEDMLNAIGQESQGVFTDSVALITNIVKHYEDFGRVLVELIGVLGVYRAAIIVNTVAESGMTLAEAAHYGWLVLVEKAQKLLNKTMLKNPYALAAAAVVALGVAIYEVVSNQNKMSASMQAVEDVTSDFNKEVIKEQQQIDKLFAKLKNAKEGTEEYDKAKSAILNNYGKYLEGLSEEIQKLEDIEGAYNAIGQAALDSARKRARANATAAAADTMAEEQGDIAEKIYELYKTKFSGQKLEEHFAMTMKKLREGSKFNQAWIDRWDEKKMVLAGDGYETTYKEITDNRLENLLTEYYRAKNQYEAAMAEADRRFGKEELPAKEEEENDAPELTKKELEERKKLARKKRETNAQFDKDNEAAAYQAGFDEQQAKIDGMEDGFAKEMAQIELNYKRLEEENRKRMEKMISDLADVREAEFLNANPNKTENDFDRSKITANDLTDKQKDILETYDNIANKQRQDAEREVLKKMLQEYETYEQKRNRIAAQYESERLAMYETDSDGNTKLREGVTKGNEDELIRQRDEALSAVDEEFASRSEEYQAWLDTIGNMTLEQLESVLKKAQEDLDNLKNTEGADMNKVAVGMARVKKLQDQIKKTQAKKDLGSPDDKAAKKWDELNGVISESAGVFKALGDAFGDTIGDIFSSLGDVTSMTGKMISSIVALAQTSGKAVKTTGETTAASMSAMEKASMILTIISTAIQLATLIAQSVDPDKKNKERIEELKNEISDLEWQLNNMDIVRTSDKIGDVFEHISKGVEGVSDEESRMEKVTQLMDERLKELNYSMDKAYGQARYREIEKQGENMVEQIAKNYEVIKREQSNKKPDEETISEAEDNIRSLQQDLQDLYNDMLEDILGGSAESIAEQLGSAFIDAFSEGTDAAQAWGEEVNNIVGDIMKKMIIQSFVEDRIAAIFDKYKQSWFDGDEMNIDEVISSMGDFKNDLDNVGEEFSQVFDMLPDDVKNMLTANASARDAASKGIATASQESVDELNGRMTAVQGHTYSISENTKMITSITTNILNHLMNIESHTSHISGKVDMIEHNVQIMRNELDTIDLQGVKIQ